MPPSTTLTPATAHVGGTCHLVELLSVEPTLFFQARHIRRITE
jgi:hypothetical protein